MYFVNDPKCAIERMIGDMKTYVVRVTEEYVYDIEIKANSQQKAIEKVKRHYNNVETNGEYDGVFVADATTHSKTRFKILK